ncbi:MAG: rRNA methylase [bacterium P3]|nr:MAG: rRNA methylase [bacterium P3]KWW40757.1 MAG: rRNA methylase [bacterium F083]
MISKKQLKELRAYRQGKHCKEEGLFVVEGVKMADEALASGWPIRTVCATEEWMAEHDGLNGDIQRWTVSESELAQLSLLRSPNEVWMLVERQYRPAIGQWTAVDVTLVLDHIQDPGNLGTLIRTADWFGIRHLVCSPDTADCFNPKVVQATMGSLFRTQIEYTDIAQWAARCKTPVYGAVLGGTPIGESALQRPCALVIGNESRGISDDVAQQLTHRVTIPSTGGSAESLNAAVAGSVLMAAIALNGL